MTAAQQHRNQKSDVTYGRWLKWAAQRFLPARKKFKHLNK